MTNSASWVGLVYGTNTLASLVGSLASGYVLINVIGSNGLIAFNSVLLLLALWGGWRTRSVSTSSCQDHVLGGVAVVGFLTIIAPRSLQVPPVVDGEKALVAERGRARDLQRGARG